MTPSHKCEMSVSFGCVASEVDMERKEMSRMPTLPEELVERIVAIVPFPYIFKVRAVSKSWLARLSPVLSHHAIEEKKPDDEEKKRLAISFQRRMAELWFIKWPTFCPVFIGKEDLVAYDRASRQWQRLPSLSFFPENHSANSKGSCLEIQGALLFISTSPHLEGPKSRRPKVVSVANVLTRSWKQLPARPRMRELFYGRQTVVSHADTYKVIEFYENNVGLSFALTYDFKENAWMRKTVEVPAGFGIVSKDCVHFKGALYWLVGPLLEMPRGLLAFNVEESTFQVLQMPAPDVPLDVSESQIALLNCFYLFVCNGSLLLVVVCKDLGEDGSSMERVIVMKIDLESQSCMEVTRGPLTVANSKTCCTRPASDGDCIFFVGQNPGGKDEVFAYNVQNKEWSSFPLPGENVFDRKEYTFDSSSFQPGLNPLAEL